MRRRAGCECCGEAPLARAEAADGRGERRRPGAGAVSREAQREPPASGPGASVDGGRRHVRVDRDLFS